MKMKHAASFKDLEVYQMSREAAKEIFLITKDFPMDEKFSLIDQIRRSSRSVGAQIAESLGKRRYKNHFILKLTDADSEQYETQHRLEVSCEIGYINKSVKKSLINKY